MLPPSCTSNRATAPCPRPPPSSGGKCYDDGWGSPAFGIPPKRDDDLVKNVAFVQAELSRLRTSTAAALQQAWDEERKSADKDERIRSLERELDTSRESERQWRAKYDELKQSVMTESLQRSSSSFYSAAAASENTDEERPRERRPSMLLRSLGQRFSNNFEEGESDDDDDQHASSPVADTSTKDSPRRRTSWLRGPPRRGSSAGYYYGGNEDGDGDDNDAVPAARRDSLTLILNWSSNGSTTSSASSTRKRLQRKDETEVTQDSAAHLAEQRLRAELAARDAALVALAESAEFRSRELDEARCELTARIEADEERRELEAAEFRRKLETRTRMIVRQRKKERECGEYIQELATELERCYRKETSARGNDDR